MNASQSHHTIMLCTIVSKLNSNAPLRGLDWFDRCQPRNAGCRCRDNNSVCLDTMSARIGNTSATEPKTTRRWRQPHRFRTGCGEFQISLLTTLQPNNIKTHLKTQWPFARYLSATRQRRYNSQALREMQRHNLYLFYTIFFIAWLYRGYRSK